MISKCLMNMLMKHYKQWWRNFLKRSAIKLLPLILILLNILKGLYNKFMVKRLNSSNSDRKILCQFGIMIVDYIGQDIILQIHITKRFIKMPEDLLNWLKNFLQVFILITPHLKQIDYLMISLKDLNRMLLIFNIMMESQELVNIQSWIIMKNWQEILKMNYHLNLLLKLFKLTIPLTLTIKSSTVI